MSIDEIKDIKKLQKMLKYERELRKYTYACCEEAGKELEKNSFAWDGKEKNLVIQAMEVNERYDKLKQTITEIKDIAENVIKNVSDICIETTPMYCVHKQILQKISEVENEN